MYQSINQIHIIYLCDWRRGGRGSEEEEEERKVGSKEDEPRKRRDKIQHGGWIFRRGEQNDGCSTMEEKKLKNGWWRRKEKCETKSGGEEKKEKNGWWRRKEKWEIESGGEEKVFAEVRRRMVAYGLMKEERRRMEKVLERESRGDEKVFAHFGLVEEANGFGDVEQGGEGLRSLALA